MPEQNKPETGVTQIQSVLDKLRTITPEVFQERLGAEPIDDEVGFSHIPLPEFGSVIAGDGQEYKFHVARIIPGRHVNPHVHFVGNEPYRIVAGEEGVMHIGTISEQTINWRPAEAKKMGDEIIVHDGEVHSFENTGGTTVDFTFACPDSHLDSTMDRQMTTNLQNSLPFYQK